MFGVRKAWSIVEAINESGIGKAWMWLMGANRGVLIELADGTRLDSMNNFADVMELYRRAQDGWSK